MGQTMANLGNKNVMDPSQAQWGDLDSSEKAARVGGGAAKGLLGGFSNMQNQNAQMRQPQPGAGGMAPMAPAAPVSPDYFAPQAPQPSQIKKPGNNNFYGGGM
jgi:hypothetical protein